MSSASVIRPRTLQEEDANGKKKPNTSLVLVILIWLAIVFVLAIALWALIWNRVSIDALDRDLETLSNETGALIERVNDVEGNATEQIAVLEEELANATVRITTLENETLTLTTLIENIVVPAGPIHGWMLFWWQDPAFGNKHSWARFNETTGVMIGTQVPYSPSEARQGSPPGKAQFSRGPNPNDMIYLVFSDNTNLQYLVRHNPAAGTYLQTYLGAEPANHGPAFIVDYDPLNARYIAVSWSLTQSFAHCLVIIDENTGVITPLSGAGGTLAPAPMNNVLDMEVIGGYVLIFERYDDDNANPNGMTNRILFYNSTDGQYLSQSFHNGTYAAYPGSILSANLQNLPTGYHVRWFVAASYDPATFRMHVVLGVSSAGYQREVGWIQGTSEADLLSQLLSGNYVINAVQHQNPFQLNAGVFLTPAAAR